MKENEEHDLPPEEEWKMPVCDFGGILVPLESAKDILADEETMRSMPRLDSPPPECRRTDMQIECLAGRIQSAATVM